MTSHVKEVALLDTSSPFSLQFPSFLLNRDDNSTPSFLPSLKVLLRHRKYIIPNIKVRKAQPRRATPPCAKYRNFNRFPFQFDDGFTNKCNPSHFLSYLTNLLGSTHSDRNALHPKPFSTSVQSVLNFVITTITKICTKGFSIRTHVLTSTKPSRSSTHGLKTFYNSSDPWWSISGPFKRHPFSGPHLSAGELLRIHYRMTASMSTAQLSKKYNTFCGV